jgi:hypothetical protein
MAYLKLHKDIQIHNLPIQFNAETLSVLYKAVLSYRITDDTTKPASDIL